MFLPIKFIKYITYTKSSHIHLLFDRNQLNMNIYICSDIMDIWQKKENFLQILWPWTLLIVAVFEQGS